MIACTMFSLLGCVKAQPISVSSADSPIAEDHQSKPAENTKYRWNNVAISGMGLVTGLVIHPHEPNLI